MSVRSHNLAPDDSESSVIDGILDFLNVSDFLSLVPGCSLFVLAVLDVDNCLLHVLTDSVSLESSENSLLVKSDWLSLVVLLLLRLINSGDLLWHCYSSLLV